MILDSARELFVSKGYSATTVDDITDRANITKKTLYGYFSDKRTLFMSVIQQAVGTAWSVEEEDENILSFEELHISLHAVAKNLNEVFSNSDYTELLRVVISEINIQPELKDLLSNGVTKRSLVKLSNIFESVQANKVAIVKDPTSSARMFVGGFVIEIYLNGLLEPAPGKQHKLSETELYQYVSDFIPMVTVASGKKCEELGTV